MNFATSDNIYSLYPLATFQNGQSLVRSCLDCSNPNINPLLHRDLNLLFIRQWSNSEVFPDGLRFVGDHITWTLNIEDAVEGVVGMPGALKTNNWLAYRTASQEYKIHGIGHYLQHLQEHYVFANDVFRRLVQRTIAQGRQVQRHQTCKKALDDKVHEAIVNQYNARGKYLY